MLLVRGDAWDQNVRQAARPGMAIFKHRRAPILTASLVWFPSFFSSFFCLCLCRLSLFLLLPVAFASFAFPAFLPPFLWSHQLVHAVLSLVVTNDYHKKRPISDRKSQFIVAIRWPCRPRSTDPLRHPSLLSSQPPSSTYTTTAQQVLTKYQERSFQQAKGRRITQNKNTKKTREGTGTK